MGNGEMKLNRYPKYKPTGIAWLPELPEGWEVVSLGRLIDEPLSYGASETGEVENAPGFVRYIRITDITLDGKLKHDGCKYLAREKAEGVMLEKGDVLFARSGATVGKSYLFNEDIEACYAGYLIRASVRREKLLPEFLLYFSQSTNYEEWKNRIFIQATIQNISAAKYTRLTLPLPPLPTQRAIVAFLDEKCGKIDRWVAAKEREVALLKELKQAMIAEAVTGATHVARTDTARKMKPSGIPWLPEVPEGWEVKKVRQHFRLRSEKVSEQDYPPLSVAKVGVVPQLADVAISMAQGETRKLVREGDYVVNSRSDRKGSCGIAPQDGSVTTISIVLEPRQIDRQFVHYLFRSTPWVEEFYRNGRGIVADLWTTRYQEMRNMVFPLPPLAEQRAIVAYIEARAAKIDAAVAGLEREIAAMKEYKQRLIADVVTGQRKVA